METMRNGVFETNSSSEHSFSIGDRNLRDPKEFPKPDEEGMVHIPWCTYDSLNKIETFTELAQLLILFVVEGLNGRLTDLFSCKNEVREQLVQSILIAYKMVGITGVDGIISVDYGSQSVTLYKENNHVEEVKVENKEPLKEELRSFVNAVQSNKEAEVTGTDGYEALRIVEAAMKSSKEKNLVYLE